ncbi:sensor histidine kinase [Microlunatus speluncae]|uniref:sensor histidine kinase n=1 Tax=Microlunatus speluncae TaxID=2594267 RepID=UPI00126613D8|nr:histidine kinase [Microlunatus speluncae]
MRLTIRPWRARSQAERVEAYTIWSLYPMSAMPPLVYVLQLLAGRPEGWLPWLILLPFVGHTALCVAMLYRVLSGRPVDRRLAVVQVAVAIPLLLALGATRGPVTDGFLSAPTLAQALVVTGTAVSWAPALGIRALVVVGLVDTVVLMLLQVHLGVGLALALGLPLGFWCLVWISVYGTSSWVLRVVRELDQARGTAARLAVAEERLRFSRDLHDVFGRVLATVAVKSELAAELATRRPADAAAAMFEVRQLAQDSLTEVRAVAAGYRQADLGNELRGARALLDSAGITCSVLGEDLTLSESVRTAFGWAVREAVTNVIRHSAATECTISVSRAAAWSRLEVINNGVTAEPSGEGSGLAGLAERLVPLGGRLEARRANDTFTLLVTLPNEDGS